MRGRIDDVRILRWVLRQAYGLRNPSAEQLRNYGHWHAVSRRDSFDGPEPPDWRCWPWKPIPPGVTPLTITYPAPAPPKPKSAPPEPAPAPMAANGTKPRRSLRSPSEPRPLKRDPKVLAVLDRADEIDAAIRLVRARLARASWPLSALMVEARAVGIGEAAVKAALAATGAFTVGGRLTLNGYANGHAHQPTPIKVAKSNVAALRAARLWIKRVLADGPRPEAEVARRLTEMGLAHLLQPAAERLGVRCRQGQWWLPSA